MNAPIRLSVAALICATWLTSSASGQFDYFPDFEVATGVGLEQSYARSNVKAASAIPDGSGRLLAARAFNRLYVIQPDGTNSTFHNLPYAPGGSDVGRPGMSSFVFHPDYTTPGADGFGKYYTLTGDSELTHPADFVSGLDELQHTILSEWTVNDIAANTFSGTGRELMRFGNVGGSHGVGDVEFGPDGMLYIAVGDDGAEGDIAQDTQSMYGKILRIDPFGNDSPNGEYGIPADNPYSNEVFAMGFRNPYRISFDQETGVLHAADVGWNSIEEVDVVTLGGNYGWPLKEGSYVAHHRRATVDEPDPVTGLTLAEEMGFTDPILEVDHTDTISIIGGFVYHGSQLPWLDGKYVFGGWNEGDLYFGDTDTGEVKLFFPSGTIRAFSGGAAIAIEEDVDGEILLWGTNRATRISAVPEQGPCDFDMDGDCDLVDLDDLLYNGQSSQDSTYDVNGDGMVNLDDRDALLVEIDRPDGEVGSLPGDSDLSGTNDAIDLNAIGVNWQQAAMSYAEGDMNGDGFVDVNDLNDLGVWWRQNSTDFAEAQGAAVVPEPNAAVLTLAGMMGLLLLRRRL